MTSRRTLGGYELDHPHIVPVFEVVADGEDGLAIAMQLAIGSASERLARRGRLPADEVVVIVRKLASALASAHRRGIVHGDVKAGNVLFTSDGEPMLADFGLGPAEGAGPADDLVALGALALELLGGELGDAPEGLGSAVARCLAGEVADAEALGAALDEGAPPSASPGTAAAADTEPRPIPAPAAAAETEPRPTPAPGVAAAPTPAPTPAPPLHPTPTPTPPTPTTTTRTFGPRPPVVAAPASPGRVVPRTAAAVVGAAALLVGGLLLLRPAGPTAPAGAAPARPGRIVEHGGVRYEVGRAGDVVVLGDWDCDGEATPAVYRAETGEAHMFDDWALDDQPLPATRTIEAAAPPVADCS